MLDNLEAKLVIALPPEWPASSKTVACTPRTGSVSGRGTCLL
jgi:hypothetical protein